MKHGSYDDIMWEASLPLSAPYILFSLFPSFFSFVFSYRIGGSFLSDFHKSNGVPVRRIWGVHGLIHMPVSIRVSRLYENSEEKRSNTQRMQ